MIHLYIYTYVLYYSFIAELDRYMNLSSVSDTTCVIFWLNIKSAVNVLIKRTSDQEVNYAYKSSELALL